MNTANDYTANGYANRRDYLESLAEDYDRSTVFFSRPCWAQTKILTD